MTRKELLSIAIFGSSIMLFVAYTLLFALPRTQLTLDDIRFSRSKEYERNKERFDRLREEVQELKREVERLNDEKRAAVQPSSEDETTFALSSRQAEELDVPLPDSVPCCGEPNLDLQELANALPQLASFEEAYDVALEKMMSHMPEEQRAQLQNRLQEIENFVANLNEEDSADLERRIQEKVAEMRQESRKRLEGMGQSLDSIPHEILDMMAKGYRVMARHLAVDEIQQEKRAAESERRRAAGRRAARIRIYGEEEAARMEIIEAATKMAFPE